MHLVIGTSSLGVPFDCEIFWISMHQLSAAKTSGGTFERMLATNSSAHRRYCFCPQVVQTTDVTSTGAGRGVQEPALARFEPRSKLSDEQQRQTTWGLTQGARRHKETKVTRQDQAQRKQKMEVGMASVVGKQEDS